MVFHRAHRRAQKSIKDAIIKDGCIDRAELRNRINVYKKTVKSAFSTWTDKEVSAEARKHVFEALRSQD